MKTLILCLVPPAVYLTAAWYCGWYRRRRCPFPKHLKEQSRSVSVPFIVKRHHLEGDVRVIDEYELQFSEARIVTQPARDRALPST